MPAHPKYRRPLNEQQLEVLDLLFNYRFNTSLQIARYFNKDNPKAIRRRLNILEDQGYVAKRYDSSYKLAGRYAEYYLAPKGTRFLRDYRQQHPDIYKDIDQIADQAIKNRYKDKTASQYFMSHSLTILDLYLNYRHMYKDKINIYPKTKLQAYSSIIRPLPDLFLTIKKNKNGHPKRYCIDYFEDSIPLFVIIRRIKNYIRYHEAGDWHDDNEPNILLITESSRRQKQVARRIAKELRDAYLDEEDVDIEAIAHYVFEEVNELI